MHIIPFQAVRPRATHAHLIASRSFIDYSDEALSDKLDTNPFSFLHVIYPDHGQVDWDQHPLEAKFERVREQYDAFVKKGWYERDAQPAFYLYQQENGPNTYTGWIGGVAAEDYQNGKIKVHEHTLTVREEMFKEYLKHTRINAEPVLLSYPDRDDLDAWVQKTVETTPEYAFATTDGCVHRLWVVDDEAHVAAIREAFAQVPCAYIADGHHRSASSSLLAREWDGPDHAPQQFFMVYLLPESQVRIRAFDRLVRELGDYTPGMFLEALRQYFTVESVFDAHRPDNMHEIGLYLDKQWYKLIPKSGQFDEQDPVEHLDCAILSNRVLEPILGIRDPKTDNRLDFQGEHEGLDKLVEKVDSGKYKAAFTLHPVTVEQLKQVADNDCVMPPKSTWIEPKLRSGLVIYELA